MAGKLEGKVPGAELGVFTHPVYLGEDSVLKVYSGGLEYGEGQELVLAHGRYVGRIKAAGIRVPHTVGRLNGVGEGYRFEVVQSRFEEGELAGEILKNGSEQEVVNVTLGIAADTIRFLNMYPEEDIGFHPTFRNYAVHNGHHYYLDTFPPFGTRAETREMILKHFPIEGGAKSLLLPHLDRFIAENYEPAKMVKGIVGSVVRQRPEYASIVKQKVSTLVRAQLRGGLREILDAISGDHQQKEHFLLLQSLMGER